MPEIRSVNRCAFIASLSLLVAPTLAHEHFTGRYADCEGKTEYGEEVTGQCWFYSNEYGSFSGETEDGESARGQCWRYSDNYATLDGVETYRGVDVTGQCYLD